MSSKWPLVKLGEVMKLSNTAILSSNLTQINLAGVYSFGRGLFARGPMSPEKTTYKTYNRLVTDDFVISQPKAWEGALARVTPEFNGWYLSPVFPTFRANREELEPAFLEWFCKRQNVWNVLQRNARGIGARRETVSSETFLSLQIPLPPLAEQQRIVARIESLAACITEAQKLRGGTIAEIGVLSSSAYYQAFQVKNDWQVLEIGNFCDNPQYGYTESAKYEPIGPKFLRITDIQNNKVEWDKVPYCECPQPEKYLLKPKDIVFARTGTIGKSFLIQECPEAVFASYLIRLRVLHTVTPEYLYTFFQSPGYWLQIADEKKGTAQSNINGQKLIQIKVPVPPLAEQHRIVTYLDNLHTKIQTIHTMQKQTNTELNAMLPAILDRAFKGEL